MKYIELKNVLDELNKLNDLLSEEQIDGYNASLRLEKVIDELYVYLPFLDV